MNIKDYLLIYDMLYNLLLKNAERTRNVSGNYYVKQFSGIIMLYVSLLICITVTITQENPMYISVGIFTNQMCIYISFNLCLYCRKQDTTVITDQSMTHMTHCIVKIVF
jgi:hypothetical protein